MSSSKQPFWGELTSEQSPPAHHRVRPDLGSLSLPVGWGADPRLGPHVTAAAGRGTVPVCLENWEVLIPI